MATIKKKGARTVLADGEPQPSISNHGTEGLRFRIDIGAHVLSLTHVERDNIIASWARMEREFES